MRQGRCFCGACSVRSGRARILRSAARAPQAGMISRAAHALSSRRLALTFMPCVAFRSKKPAIVFSLSRGGWTRQRGWREGGRVGGKQLRVQFCKLLALLSLALTGKPRFTTSVILSALCSRGCRAKMPSPPRTGAPGGRATLVVLGRGVDAPCSLLFVLLTHRSKEVSVAALLV